MEGVSTTDKIIEIKINGSHLTRDSQTAGVQHEGNAAVLRMEFDPGWDGFAKTVTFWNARGEKPVKRLLTTDLLEDMMASSRIYRCPIPPEAMTEAGKLTYVVDGMAGDVRQRSVEDSLRVLPAGYAPEAAESTDPTPTQAEQLQLQVEALRGEIREGIEASGLAVSGAAAADASRQAAQSAAADAAASQQRAAESEAAAKLAAGQCEASVSGVASFNGRGGHVMPQSGDYTAAMVGAAPVLNWSKSLSAPGWYRIASVPMGETSVKPFTMLLSIGGVPVINTTTVQLLAIGIYRQNDSTKEAVITKLLNNGSGAQIWNVRVLYDTSPNTCNIEVYYSKSAQNTVNLSAQILSGSCTKVDFTAQAADAGEVMAQQSLFEWVNPLLHEGYEYPTAERYMGKPVYARLFAFGAAPSDTTAVKEHGISAIDKAVFCCAMDASGGAANPGTVVFDTSHVSLTTPAAYAGRTVYTLLKYTKTTD